MSSSKIFNDNIICGLGVDTAASARLIVAVMEPDGADARSQDARKGGA